MHLCEQVKVYRSCMNDLDELCTLARSHFMGPKFNPPDDYARTHEMLSRIEEMRYRIGETRNEIGLAVDMVV